MGDVWASGSTSRTVDVKPIPPVFWDQDRGDRTPPRGREGPECVRVVAVVHCKSVYEWWSSSYRS